ncbi:hypothetical protein RRF57_011823 [Xylaria bambusicola]|uniref:Uncharacterized protein n=1 Tax=Xylaria bambusicola TaxID=326684 RepID=A0AAN7ZA93_9PEZI
MLSQHRWRGPYAWAAFAVFDRGVDHLDRPTLTMLQLNHHAPRACVLVVERVLDVVHRGVRHALALEHI